MNDRTSVCGELGVEAECAGDWRVPPGVPEGPGRDERGRGQEGVGGIG